jgi:hypothetical protein
MKLIFYFQLYFKQQFTSFLKIVVKKNTKTRFARKSAYIPFRPFKYPLNIIGCRPAAERSEYKDLHYLFHIFIHFYEFYM